MNRTEWYRNEENRRQLADALNNTALKQAIAILKDEAEPKSSNETELNATLAVSRFHASAGFYKAFSELEKLTQEPVVPKSPPRPRELLKDVIATNVV